MQHNLSKKKKLRTNLFWTTIRTEIPENIDTHRLGLNLTQSQHGQLLKQWTDTYCSLLHNDIDNRNMNPGKTQYEQQVRHCCLNMNM